MHNAGVAVQGRTGTIAVERSDVLRSLSIYQHKTVMTNSSSHSDESALLKNPGSILFLFLPCCVSLFSLLSFLLLLPLLFFP